VATGLVAAAAVLLVARPRSHSAPRGGATPPKQKSIAFAVDAGAASRVSLVGDFNNWDRSGTPMTRDQGGAWHASVALPVGIYRYAFLVDDARWIVDPAETALVDHDFGEPTSVVTVE
jgi:1,4-alpha-glucan branching enzyme